MKLTATQRAVLERMAEGDEVLTTPWPKPSAFWKLAPIARAPRFDTLHILELRGPRFDTLHILELRGLIENHEAHNGEGLHYRITEAGRAAIRD